MNQGCLFNQNTATDKILRLLSDYNPKVTDDITYLNYMALLLAVLGKKSNGTDYSVNQACRHIGV